MRNTLTNTITKYAGDDKKIFFVTGDAGYGVLDEYRNRFPERFLNMGVAEQNMISFSAGLGLAGYKVFVYNIVPFILFRCYEQVRNDICYQRVPVTLIGIGSGITYAPQGITHYSVEDIAIARTLPNLVILSPADPVEAEICAAFALKSKGPVYIRVAKSGEQIIHKDRGKVKDITSPIVVKEGEGVAVLFHGSIADEVLKAAEDLKKSPRLISIPMIQPLNFSALLKNLEGIHTLVTVEEHYIGGGLACVISDWLIDKDKPFKLKKLGIKNEFIHEIKNRTGMRNHYGISSENIRKTITESFKNG